MRNRGFQKSGFRCISLSRTLLGCKKSIYCKIIDIARAWEKKKYIQLFIFIIRELFRVSPELKMLSFHISFPSLNFIVLTFFIHLITFCRWKRNVHKIAFAKGLPTVDTKGRPKPGRSTGPSCKCASECFSLVDGRERRWVLDQFNTMADRNLQNLYLRGLIVAEEPGEIARAFRSYDYYVQTSDTCRTKVR